MPLHLALLAMNTKFHSDKSVWDVITTSVKHSQRKVVAAVAYIGDDAPQILPLKQGDTLVCNASDASIKSGSTSAAALKALRAKGVKIYNCENLHAKVVVLSRRAFVGSANASKRSREHLAEAVVETTDIDVIAKAREFVERRAVVHKIITKDQLERLSALPVRKAEPLPPDLFEPLTLPRHVPRLWIAGLIRSELTANEKQGIEKNRKKIREQLRNEREAAGIDSWPWGMSDGALRVGDWILAVYPNSRTEKPVKIIGISHISKTRRIIWVARPKDGRSSILLREALAEISFDHKTKSLILVKKNAKLKWFKPFMKDKK
jgi:hypothetical protein